MPDQHQTATCPQCNQEVELRTDFPDFDPYLALHADRDGQTCEGSCDVVCRENHSVVDDVIDAERVNALQLT